MRAYVVAFPTVPHDLRAMDAHLARSHVGIFAHAGLEKISAMRKDFYASPFGAAYSAYMERPLLSRLIGLAVWGGDSKPYYESMSAIAEVPEGGVIVDCPCGAGPALRALRPEAAVRYIAADLSPSMIQRTRRRARSRGLASVEFVQADATDLPIPTGGADLFLSYWGLHCFEDPAAAITEAARVLKPGSRLVGSCFVRGAKGVRQQLLIRPGSGDFGQVGTRRKVEGWLARVGFSPVIMSSSGPMLFFDARFPDVLEPPRSGATAQA